jgi:hypothetical protein
MAKKKRAARVTKIDPVFKIPAGAEDEFAYTDKPVDQDDLDTTAYLEDLVIPLPPSGIGTPTSFRIVNQVIRRGNGNHQIVDVVIETDDIPGAVKYEIKVTKA